MNAENSIYQYEYCSDIVQNILVVPEMMCVNRVWCQCDSKGARGGRQHLPFLQEIFAGGVCVCFG